MKVRMLSAADLDAALPMPLVMEAVAQAYQSLSRGRAVMPQRLALETEAGVSLCMPAYLPDLRAATVKVVSVYPGNPARGVGTIQALVLVLDTSTGEPMAIMEGARLTGLRTGAASGVATLLLARPEASVLALIGAGGQAWFQFLGVAAARGVGEVRVYDPRPAAAEVLAARIMEERPGVAAWAAGSAGEALAGAEVVCCSTTSREPVFAPEMVGLGTHINGVGSFKPEMREVPVTGMPGLSVWVDYLPAALAESGELIEALAAGTLKVEAVREIGQALAGGMPGRDSPQEITFFKSVGLAAQDAAAAGLALTRARELGLGGLVEL